jgi:hypothetical protein
MKIYGYIEYYNKKEILEMTTKGKKYFPKKINDH